MNARAVARILTLALPPALLCASCSKAPKLHPVQGKVMFGGKPAHGAIVVFHPVGDPNPGAARPSAVVDEHGSFTLGTSATGNGAPAGEYLVAIAWFDETRKRDPVTGDIRSKLPERYSDPETSKLRVTIKEGPNQLEPFVLTP